MPAGLLVAEGAVRPPFSLVPEDRLQLGVGLDLGAVALHVDVLVFYGAPEVFDECSVKGMAPAIYRELHHASHQRLGGFGGS